MIKTAKEQYLTLKSFNHYLCTAIPTGRGENGIIEVHLIYCKHNDKDHRKILITKEDL